MPNYERVTVGLYRSELSQSSFSCAPIPQNSGSSGRKDRFCVTAKLQVLSLAIRHLPTMLLPQEAAKTSPHWILRGHRRIGMVCRHPLLS